MPTLLIYAVILFTVALVFYTWGVWAEFRVRRLRPRHAKLFFAGVCADTLGTVLTYIAIGGLVFTPHSITGFICLALMVFHLIWALLVLRRRKEHALTHFHKFSIFVWSVWMLSYVSGFISGMGKM